MKKYETLSRLREAKIIAVVRASGAEQAVDAVGALVKGGIYAIELAFTTPHADRAIAEIDRKFGDDILLGAGTVLDVASARLAILAGAKYYLAPSLDPEVLAVGNIYGVPAIPGIATATEAVNALKAGADVVKLFPAHQYSPSMIKDLRAPLPNLEVIPTGGIGEDNLREWLDAGAFAVGVGGKLFAGLKTGDLGAVTDMAKRLTAIAK